MYKKIFLKPGAEVKHRNGLFGAYYDYFVNWMQDHRYSVYTMQSNVWHVTYFGRYLKRRGIKNIHQLEGSGCRKLLASYARCLKKTGRMRRHEGLKLFTKVLHESGVLANVVFTDPLLPSTQEYEAFLKEQKGLSESIIYSRHLFYVEKFLMFLGCETNKPSIPNFDITDIDKFIELRNGRVKYSTIRIIVGVLRSFIQFLYQTGKVDIDISSHIAGPRNYKLQSLPTVLPWSDVQKVLDSVDRSKKSNLRSYTILVLLSTYGLRAGEVARLKLEDIDWRKEIIHVIPGKSRRPLNLPLTTQAGKAIIKYLKHGRPPSKYREIFLLKQAPWTPISSNIISFIANRYTRLAGLDLPRRGAHILRHSFATHLMRGGASLKEIGDLLGHEHPESTHTYTKTVTEHLREVALEIPEVK